LYKLRQPGPRSHPEPWGRASGRQHGCNPAEQAWRITRERRVFALSGEWVGRIEDVRDSPADGGLTGILRVRRRYGGRVALPWADSSRPTASSWPQRQPRSLKRR